MDRAVQKTDTDALESKASAVQKGYYNDQYISLFTKRVSSRLPLINIGTYCRWYACETLINKFLELEGPKQIVSLGAGSDTRPFRLHRDDLVYYELDFATKVKQKAATIRKSPELFKAVGSPSGIDELHSDSYHLIACDLRDLNLQLPNIPTLLLSECCLCYLSPEASNHVLSFFKKMCPRLSVVLYEPIGLDDEFGRVMMENLAMRGLSLPSFKMYNTLNAQIERLKSMGIEASANDIWSVYTKWLSPQDKERIAKLEFLDEVEEIKLLLNHYSIVWSTGS